MSRMQPIIGHVTPERLRRAAAIVARCARNDPALRPIFKVLDEAVREAEMAEVPLGLSKRQRAS